MGPWSALGNKLPQKGRRNQCTGPAVACNRAQVGDLRVELAADLARDGQSPDVFTSCLRRIEHQISGRIVSGHEPGRTLPKCYHTRASQGCYIDQQIGLVLVRPGNGIGHDESPFGVGVAVLHRLAAIDGQYV